MYLHKPDRYMHWTQGSDTHHRSQRTAVLRNTRRRSASTWYLEYSYHRRYSREPGRCHRIKSRQGRACSTDPQWWRKRPPPLPPGSHLRLWCTSHQSWHRKAVGYSTPHPGLCMKFQCQLPWCNYPLSRSAHPDLHTEGKTCSTQIQACCSQNLGFRQSLNNTLTSYNCHLPLSREGRAYNKHLPTLNR